MMLTKAGKELVTMAVLCGAAAGLALAVYAPPSPRTLAVLGATFAAFGAGLLFGVWLMRGARDDAELWPRRPQ